MKSNNVLLRIEGLRIQARSEAGWQEIVKGVDLTVRRGEILGLIGESGAGKSTVGLAAMGYARDGCRIGSGRVIFDGVDLTALPERKREPYRGRRIAYVSQSAAASFNPAHRLISQFCEAPLLHGVSDRATAEHDAIELFRRVLLPDPENIGFRYPHQVSGGQLQRAMTAMAMSCRPDLIIFDEPTTALDVTTQIEVLATIRDIVRRFNNSAIYITHDLAVVAQLADRIKVLLRGEEVEEAKTEDMLSKPREAYTRSLWAVRAFQREEQSLPTKGVFPLISLQNVSAGYGREQIIHDLSFDIHRRRTIAIVGESGSGKTTVARIICGLLPPSNGQILFDDKALPPEHRKRSKEQLRAIQLIYQMADTALNPKQRVREILGWPVEFYLGLRGKARKERVRELLSLIELEPDTFMNRLPSELSGGEKQRIGIARALAAEPQFVICDDGTSALDQLVAEGILRLLDRLRAELGLTYMFITHDIATVKAIADDLVVMNAGRLVESGLKSDVFSSPQAAYTKKLIASVPEMDVHWLDRLLAERI